MCPCAGTHHCSLWSRDFKARSGGSYWVGKYTYMPIYFGVAVVLFFYFWLVFFLFHCYIGFIDSLEFFDILIRDLIQLWWTVHIFPSETMSPTQSSYPFWLAQKGWWWKLNLGDCLGQKMIWQLRIMKQGLQMLIRLIILCPVIRTTSYLVLYQTPHKASCISGSGVHWWDWYRCFGSLHWKCPWEIPFKWSKFETGFAWG